MRHQPTSLPTLALGGDLTVARIGLGALGLTGLWGEPADRDGAIAVLRHAVDQGVTLIDTADSYAAGVNEALIAQALHPYPAGVVIATKGGVVRHSAERWVKACRPDELRQACEASLQRLRIERIDLYQLHTVDREVPFAESVGALAALRQEGKIRHVGLSNVNEAQLGEATGIVPIASVQNRYNLAEQQADGVVAACERAGAVFMPWHPLADGKLAQHPAVAAVARRHNATPAQIALAWLLRRSPTVLPIPGTRSAPHLDENLLACRIQLQAADLAELASCSPLGKD